MLISVVGMFLIDLFTKRWVERTRWVVMTVEIPGDGVRENGPSLETAGEMLRNTQLHSEERGKVSKLFLR